jgi:two-component system response regulator YesN
MKIVVVEDEVRTRMGIVKLISELDAAYVLSGEAGNGLDGVNVIERTQPDLVITDIKMPDMDGLEMIKAVKDGGSPAKFIILSGYAEFDYAKKAMAYGIRDYLLKPVTAEDIAEALLRNAGEIASEKAVRTVSADRRLSCGKILEEMILSNNVVLEDSLDYLQKSCGMDIHGAFSAVLLNLGGYGGNDREELLRLFGEEIKKFEAGTETIRLDVLNEAVAIVPFRGNPPDGYLQNDLLRRLHARGYCNAIMGVIAFQGLGKLKDTLDLIRQQMSWTIVFGEDVLVSYYKVQNIKTKELAYPQNLERNAVSAVFSSNIARLRQCCEEFLALWRRDLYLPQAVLGAFVRFASSIINSVKETDGDLYGSINHTGVIRRMARAISWAELRGAMEELVAAVANKLGKDARLYSLVVKKALNLINESYTGEITLEGLAARLNVTQEYLCALFSREVGRNFSCYLKELRIRKAKELLQNSDLKIYEVAVRVGYSNPKYFCRVFKEVTGLSAGAYMRTRG